MKAIKLSITAIALFITYSNSFAQTADEVISKHITAIGGTASWDKIKSVKLVGGISQGGMEINMVQTIVNDKGMRTDITAMGMSGYMIITPTEGWMYMPFGGVQTKPEPIPADQLKLQKDNLNFKNTQLVDRSKISKSVFEGRDTLNNVPCFKLKVTMGDDEQECYFDAKTYYLLRTERKLKVLDEETEMAITYSDFKKQPEGIVFPMTMATAQGEVKFKSIEINKPIDSKIFTLPAEGGK